MPTNNPQLGMPESSTSMGNATAKPMAGFWFNIQKWPVAVSGGVSLAKKPCFDTKQNINESGRKSARGASTSTTDSWKKGSQGGWCPNVLQSLTSSPSYSSVVQVGTCSKFLDQ